LFIRIYLSVSSQANFNNIPLPQGDTRLSAIFKKYQVCTICSKFSIHCFFRSTSRWENASL